MMLGVREREEIESASTLGNNASRQYESACVAERVLARSYPIEIILRKGKRKEKFTLLGNGSW